ncbi:hypothetical protein PIB30_004171 [Stylosanthes scabra]|uniref:Uncharacterized protein n=1 Tax=Stylosanthes scabra TaxID=79078 RepID=A0ABU6Q3I2_9FABA|nr:hypothetical protein [Stylosanthes scabra]
MALSKLLAASLILSFLLLQLISVHAGDGDDQSIARKNVIIDAASHRIQIYARDHATHAAIDVTAYHQALLETLKPALAIGSKPPMAANASVHRIN